jgi:probable O-glycosylation ligase (exosortase A-associated)
MRDMFFLALLPLMLYAMAKRPFIAVGMWIWTAMFFPNAWMYGVASGLRYNLIFTAVAILGYLVLKDKPKVHFGAIGAFVLLFLFWTTVSTIGTSGVPEVAWEMWSRFAKVVLLFIFVILVLDKKLHFDFFLWCVVLSIGFYAGLEALKYVASGGGHKIEGFYGHVLGDRNELALAFVMTMPLCAYLLGEYGKQALVIRAGLLGLMGLIVLAIIGTQSRGGFVAMMGLAGYYFLKSDRKVVLSVLVAVLVAVLSNVVSDEWMSRMDTIGEAGEDASFMGRVVAWKLSFILAVQNPFFGGGFKTLEWYPMWLRLSQDFFAFPFFYTGEALPDPNKGHAAHSVYFQVLGEHGFGGLIVYLTMLFVSFRTAWRVAAKAKKHVETAWIASLATMLQLSIFAFALGGAALSFAYFELLFAIAGIVQVLHSRVLPRALAAIGLEEKARRAADAAAAAAPEELSPALAKAPLGR